MNKRKMWLKLAHGPTASYSILLEDDGYRLWLRDYVGPAKNVDPTDRELFLEYKHFDFPGIGQEIIDAIWKGLLATGGIEVDPDDAADVGDWAAEDCNGVFPLPIC